MFEIAGGIVLGITATGMMFVGASIIFAVLVAIFDKKK